MCGDDGAVTVVPSFTTSRSRLAHRGFSAADMCAGLLVTLRCLVSEVCVLIDMTVSARLVVLG